MSQPIKLVLLYGGKSGEHEVSLVSAASVLAALDRTKYEIIPIGIDKQGCYYRHAVADVLQYKDALPVKTEQSEAMPSLIRNGQLAIDADVVFPVVHGPLYEDGCLQGLLELADVAYVGCDVLASAIGMDKDMTRRVACRGDIVCARYKELSWHSSAKQRQAFCEEAAKELGWPLFVKPCALGSSVGIHKVHTLAELAHAVEDALRYDESILVEEMIEGREIELAVLENRNDPLQPRVSGAGEIAIHHADGFYSYSAKYIESEKSELRIPATLDSALLNALQDSAKTIFKRLKCKGMARVDFFVNDAEKRVIFNEINTIPGFTPISMYPKLWAQSGLSYSALLDELIALARMHHQCRKQWVTDYQ